MKAANAFKKGLHKIDEEEEDPVNNDNNNNVL